MSTRRNFLAGVAGVAAVGTLAGCLGLGDDADDTNDEPFAGEGIETDDELLSSLADPSSQVPPLYFSGYQYRIGEMDDSLDPAETIPRLGGSVAGLFDGDGDEDGNGEGDVDSDGDDLSLDDLDRITGSIYNSSTSGGALDVDPLPSGQAVHATGAFDAAPLIDLLEASDAQESIGESDGYERYMTEIQGGDGVEAWGVRDGRLIIVSRTDVTSRSDQLETKEETATDALSIEFDQVERDDAPIANSAPAFADVVQTLDDGPIRAGAAYALIPLGADTGTQAFDDAIRGVVGAGLRAEFGDSQTLQRSVSYLDPEMASEETVSNAYEASETEEISLDAWEFDTEGTTVTTRAPLDELPTTAMYQTGLPVPGYESLFNRVNPETLGREPSPRVFFSPAIDDDGLLEITHGGGETVEDLQIRYVHDGEAQHEDWTGEISEGDQFTSENTVDSDTQSWVTWRPDTVDAAALIRFQA